MAGKFTPYADLTKEQRAVVLGDNMVKRVQAAQDGLGLDVLVVDENTIVRCAVAQQEYRLDKLVDDYKPEVRGEVVGVGYGLDKLINDHDEMVRGFAERKLAEMGLTLDEWIYRFPDKCVLEESEKVLAAMEHKHDCEMIDNHLRGSHWLNEDGEIVLDDDPLYLYSAAAHVYEHRNLPPDQFDMVLDDEIFWDWEKSIRETTETILDEVGISWDDNNDRWEEARYYLEDAYGVNPPYRQIYGEELKVNIVLWTEREKDIDSTSISKMKKALERGEEVDEYLRDNMLVKLCESQGYSFEDLAAAYKLNRSEESKAVKAEYGEFLESVVQEMETYNGHMGALTVLSTVEARDVNKISNPGSEIKVGKDAMLGVFDPWYGYGGLLEIKLEKPFVVPTDRVFDVQVEGHVPNDWGSYSVDKVYGLFDESWRPAVEVAEPGVLIAEEQSEKPDVRVPGQLKQAAGKPRAVDTQAATPGQDGKVCSASAVARAGEGPVHDVKRQK